MPIRAHMPPDAKLIAVGVFSPFFVPLKVLMMAAVLLALPWLMYQAWMFVAPGLYSHEKRFALPLIFFGSLLAYGGIAFVQFFVLDKMFAFIQSFAPPSVAATPDIASYVESILSLYIAFGVAFQVPIVVMLLVRFEMVTIEKLRSFRGYFIVIAFVIAAVLTPPDVVSQLALAIPMCLLYEVGIVGAKYFVRFSKAPDAEDEGKADSAKPWSRRRVSLIARLGRRLRRGRSLGRAPGVTSTSTLSPPRCSAKRSAVPGLRPATAVSSSCTLSILLVAHAGDHVARPDAGLGRRAVLQHAGDDGARLGLDAEGLRQFGRQVVRLHADPAARDLAVLDDAFQHQLGGGYRNGEADAHAAARARIDRGVDAHRGCR